MNSDHLNHLREACKGAVGKASQEKYLPLWIHLADTAGVMEYLIRKTLADHQIELLCEKISGETLEEKRETLVQNAVFLALVHDIGKLTAGFQAMICHDLPEKPETGFPLQKWKRMESTAWSHHPATGMGILNLLDFPDAFAQMTGAHHGLTQRYITGSYRSSAQRKPGRNSPKVCFNSEILTPITKYLYGDSEREFWQSAWVDATDAALGCSGFQSAKDLAEFTLQGQILLTGLLIEADWIASDENLFPLISVDETISPTDLESRLTEGIRKFHLPDVPEFSQKSLSKEQFEKTFSFLPNPVQQEVLDIVSGSAEHPGLMIIESQMGSGKTEAALAAAICLNARSGCDGIMMGLPTQSSANGLYPRFAEWARSQAGEGQYSLRLAHGKARFNQDYALLSLNSQVDSDSSDHLLVHDWTRKPKTALMADFVLGTVDQCLSAALNRKHFMLRHLGLSKKTVIIDEVHSYDAYMSTYLYSLLEWLGSYHIPVILLSATLPHQKKNKMIQHYLKGRRKKDESKSVNLEIPESTAYPRITWTSGDQAYLNTVDWKTESKVININAVSYSDSDNEFSRIRDSLKTHLKDGGCAAVLMNTVKKAQDLYEYLCTELNQEFILFHSRFTDGDRAKIEQEVLRRAGKESGSKEREGLVVIGTQVIEQSIDADFDFMITELAPVDLLLQRSGRLHRHKRKRPESLEIPELEVMIAPDRVMINPDKESKVYDSWLMIQTRKHLPDQIQIPEDVTSLVNLVYGDNEPETDIEKFIQNKYVEKQEEKGGKAGPRALRNPRTKQLNGLMGESADLVRSDSVREESEDREVILLERRSDDLFEIPGDSSMLLERNQQLTDQQKELLRKASIRVPVYSSWSSEFDRILEKTDAYFSNWKKAGAMPAEHFLILDPEKKEEISFVYSEKSGLSRIR